MTAETLGSLFAFALVGSITPGPNNLLLLNSGLRFGLRRSLPLAAGIVVGFATLLLGVGLGLGALLAAAPELRLVLKALGAGYLLWLAWKIWTAAVTEDPAGEAVGTPVGFPAAFGFQWLNPKGVMLAVSVFAIYADGVEPWRAQGWINALFFVASTISALTWAAFGLPLRRWLDRPRRRRDFNRALALLLVASLWPLVRG